MTASFKALLLHVRCHCASLTGSAGGERGVHGAAGGAAAKGHAGVAVQNSLFFSLARLIVFKCLFIHNQVGLILHFTVSFGCLVPLLLSSS